MNIQKGGLLFLSMILVIFLFGAGCVDGSDKSFPPKPPVPGIQQSPLIDRLSP